MKALQTIICALTLLPMSCICQTRDDAGLQGNAGATSGFFETYQPINYPQGASSWWHLLDVRHSNINNNFAMQFAGSFWDQELYFRKTNNRPDQPWKRILTETDGQFVFGKTEVDNTQSWDRVLQLNGTTNAKLIVTENSGVKVGLFSHRDFNAKIGTESNHNLTFMAGYWNDVMTLTTSGNVGIGTQNPTSKLAVNGLIRAKEIKVEVSNWPDYVFDRSIDFFRFGTLKPTLRKTDIYLESLLLNR